MNAMKIAADAVQKRQLRNEQNDQKEKTQSPAQ